MTKRFTAEDRALWPDGHRVCLLCREMKPFSEFGKNKGKYGGVNDWCKVCRKPRAKASYEKWFSDNREKRMLSSARARARSRGLDFDLELDDIVIPEYCPVLGIKLSTETGNKNQYDSPSLDRIDSSKGYVKGNVAVISWRANWIKQNATLEEVTALQNWMSSNTDNAIITS